MSDRHDEPPQVLSDPDPVRRAQIQMLKPLPKRFYTEVTIGAGASGGHTILLDGRSVRTPAKNLLAVPTRSVADMLLIEWDAQKTVIDPATMPVTRIVNTAIDGVAQDVRAVFDDIVNFAGTDLLCYRAGEPEGLVARQNEKWDPVVRLAAERLGARFILVEGIVHRTQPRAAINGISDALRAYATPLGLACLHTITTLTGSALLAIAFAERWISAPEAWALAHVDEDWQIAHWGTDAEAFQRREKRWQEMQAATATFDALR